MWGGIRAGAALAAPLRQLGNTTYRNPTPVAVVLVPVDDGLLVIRRGAGNERGVGQLGLPGGYIDFADENWQAGAARRAVGGNRRKN